MWVLDHCSGGRSHVAGSAAIRDYQSGALSQQRSRSSRLLSLWSRTAEATADRVADTG